MLNILIKAGCYIAIIILGIILRRIGFFKESDFSILSRIVLRVTLPAALIVNAATRDFSPQLLTLSLPEAGVTGRCARELWTDEATAGDTLSAALAPHDAAVWLITEA